MRYLRTFLLIFSVVLPFTARAWSLFPSDGTPNLDGRIKALETFLQDPTILASTATQVTATGGTTARTLGARASDVINVVDHGARCDGTTDDTAAFAHAMALAEARGGGTVVMPEGTCVIVSVEMIPHVTLRGAGIGATVVKMKSGLTVLDYTTDRTGHPVVGVLGIYTSYPSGGYNGNLPLDGIQLRDFSVNCNYAGSPGVDTWGIYLNAVTNARIENVYVTACGSHGFTIKESTYGVFRHLRGDANGAHTAGDGFVFLSRCTDNLLADSSFSNNASGGVEDEGRFGSYLYANRNQRNRMENLYLASNGDNGADAVFSDYSEWRNVTVIGGASGPNAACHQLVGTTNALIDGFRCDASGREGIRVWSEVFGPDGVNTAVTIRNAEVTTANLRAVVLEGVNGGSVQVKSRGVGGGYAVALASIGYGRSGVDAALDPTCVTTDSAGRPKGYGFGSYATGKPYPASPICHGYGAFVQSGNWIYELTAAYTGTGLSVTAPTCGSIGCTSADNGGTWTCRGRVGSEGLTLDVDYDGSTGVKATYGVYAYAPVDLTLRGKIMNSATDNVWIDGPTASVSGLRLENVQAINAGTRTLTFTSGVLTGGNNYLRGGDLSGSGGTLSWATVAGQLWIDPWVIGLGLSAPTITSGTGAPSADAQIGSIYLRTDGSTSTTLYVKTAAGAGAGNWTAK